MNKDTRERISTETMNCLKIMFDALCYGRTRVITDVIKPESIDEDIDSMEVARETSEFLKRLGFVVDISYRKVGQDEITYPILTIAMPRPGFWSKLYNLLKKNEDV